MNPNDEETRRAMNCLDAILGQNYRGRNPFSDPSPEQEEMAGFAERYVTETSPDGTTKMRVERPNTI